MLEHQKLKFSAAEMDTIMNNLHHTIEEKIPNPEENEVYQIYLKLLKFYKLVFAISLKKSTLNNLKDVQHLYFFPTYPTF